MATKVTTTGFFKVEPVDAEYEASLAKLVAELPVNQTHLRNEDEKPSKKPLKIRPSMSAKDWDDCLR